MSLMNQNAAENEKVLVIQCREPYYSYDAYHLTAAFFPEYVREGRILQETGPGEGEMSREADSQTEPAVQVTVRCNTDRDVLFTFTPALNEDRKDSKSRMGRELYRALSEASGRELPWGILTGIRPVKIVRKWLEEGLTADECVSRFMERTLASNDRSELAVRIAQTELEILKAARESASRQGSSDQDGICVYVHIPFCPSRCSYCSFASVPADKYAKHIDRYLDCLEKEMRAAAEMLRSGESANRGADGSDSQDAGSSPGRHVSSIYVGGGTPTVLSAQQLERLCGMIRRFAAGGSERAAGAEGADSTAADPFVEWTVEAGRPDTITADKLRVLKAAGVTRISINPQSMHDETLRRIGRAHSSEQIVEAFNLARAEGFDNINMDLIAGLDGESADDFRKTLGRIAELDPESVTVHALAVKRASIMGQDRDRPLPPASEVERMGEEARRRAKEQGLEPYYLYRQKNISGNGENIGFAKPGKGCLYNILIMEEVQDILAFGAGAISKFVDHGSGLISRVDNVKDVLLYMEQIDEMIKRKERVLC